MNKISAFFNTKLYLLGWLIIPLLLLFQFSSSIMGVLASQPENKAEILNEVPKEALSKFRLFNVGNSGVATILFNNGWKSQYEYGYSYLNKKDVKGAVSTMTDYIGYPGYFDWNRLQEVQDNGWEIMSSGKNYRCEWDSLNTDQLRDEVYGSRQEFLKHKIYVDHFASPCGKADLRLSSMVAYYFSSQKIGEEGVNLLPLKERYLLRGRTVTNKTTTEDINNWLSEARNNNGWVIFTFNQIDESDNEWSITPAKFEQLANQIIDSQIPIIVPSQIATEQREVN